MNKPLESDSPALGIPSPGLLLSARREEYGWSIREVARALHLSERQVEAIERDDYAHLPGKTYVMGYWRNYAQLLDIPIEASVQVHRANLSGVKGSITLARGHGEDHGKDERSRKRAAVLFGMLLAAFLGAVWYWQDPDADLSHWIGAGMDNLANRNGEAPVPGDTTPAVAPAPVPEPVSPVEESILALPEPNFTGEEDQQTVEINTRGYEVLVAELPLSRPDLVYQRSEPVEAPEGAVVAATDSAATTEQPAGGAQPAQATGNQVSTPAPASTAPAPSTEATVATAPAPQQPPAAPEPTTTGDNRIAFQVSRESWIDVRDSSGERLIYRTVNRGEDIRLAGVPPYHVFIGSAEGVSVLYQGREVPFKVHESGLFARFEVGAQ